MNESHAEPTASPEVETSGTLIAGRYRIERLIARGGMAAVYLAHQVNLNRQVAIKILTPPTDPEAVQDFQTRFHLEAKTLASFDHPNIVVLYDFGELPGGRFYLAMEYIEGPRLADIVKQGPLSVERTFQLVYQVAEALRYAHRRGVIHRDLKPSNLLVTRRDDGTDRVKVVDFGLVKLVEAEQDITRAGLILGSPHCMSPEQVKGLEVDARADIYALGVLMFRCLTGTYPFHGANAAATMIAHLNDPLPRFAEVAPDRNIPDAVEQIVRRCLARSPSDRYHDVADLLADMLPCMEFPPALYASQSRTTLPQAPRPTSDDTRWLVPALSLAVMVLASVLIAVALFIGYVVTRPLPTLDVAAPVPPTTASPRSPPVAAPRPASVEPPPADMPPPETSPSPEAPEVGTSPGAPPPSNVPRPAPPPPEAAPPASRPEATPPAPRRATPPPSPQKPKPPAPASERKPPAPTTERKPPAPASTTPKTATPPSPPKVPPAPAPTPKTDDGYLPLPDDF